MGLEGEVLVRSARPASAIRTSSRSQVPTPRGSSDDLITHTMPLEEINTAFDLMHRGESIRSVVQF